MTSTCLRDDVVTVNHQLLSGPFQLSFTDVGQHDDTPSAAAARHRDAHTAGANNYQYFPLTGQTALLSSRSGGVGSFFGGDREELLGGGVGIASALRDRLGKAIYFGMIAQLGLRQRQESVHGHAQRVAQEYRQR